MMRLFQLTNNEVELLLFLLLLGIGVTLAFMVGKFFQLANELIKQTQQLSDKDSVIEINSEDAEQLESVESGKANNITLPHKSMRYSKRNLKRKR